MAVAWSWGWEVRAPLAFYTGAAWSSSGTVDPNERVTTYQHPLGYGGGNTSLRSGFGGYLRSAPMFTTVGQGGMNTCLNCVGTFDSASVVPLVAVRDSSGAIIVSLHPADTGATSRITVKHNGVTVGTSAAQLAVNAWQRVAVRWSVSAGTITITLWLSGVQLLSASTTETAVLPATTVEWGAPGAGSGAAGIYHDHTVVYTTSADDPTPTTWVQGLRPNADDINGAWTPVGAASRWAALTDANDASYIETTSASTVQVNLDNRTAVNALWTTPRVLGVTVIVAGKGDGALLNGTPGMSIAGSTTTGVAVGMAAGGDLCSLMALDKPGGVGWAAADLDNLALRYGAS